MEDKTFKQAEKLITKRFLEEMGDQISQMVFRYREDYAADCKSEIEQMFLLGWLGEMFRRNLLGASCGGDSGWHVYPPGTTADLASLLPSGLHEWNIIIPQFPIGEYRVDFLLAIAQRDPSSGERSLAQVIVECDGHDFHEKTKQQAARDKSRDRALQLGGYHVLHFTGSEIWNGLDKCIEEVMEFLQNKIDEK